MPPRPLTDSGSIKIFLFAPYGWGKTRLLGTSPGKGLIIRPPVDYVDSMNQDDKKRFKQWVVHDWSEMDDVEMHLRHEGKDLYDWVWFDSISAFQDIGLDDLWDTIIIEKPHRKRYGLDKGDYWINMQRIGRWVRNVATISDAGDFHFGITAWPAELPPSPEDPEAEKKQMPWVQGKNMATKIAGYSNIVAFGDYTKKGSRIVHFRESERCYAKCQFDTRNGPGTVSGMGYKMLSPTMPKIIDMVKKSGGLSETTRRSKPQRRTRVRGSK